VLTLRALALAVLTIGCTSTGATTAVPATPTRAPDYRPSQLRLTALVVRVTISPDATVSEGERAALPGLYESALVEGLNERALVVRDVGLATRREPPGVAAARAREVGADHALVVDVRIAPDVVRVCEETARPLRGRATVFAQEATVVRASDGAVRSTLSVNVPAVEVDCDAPRPGARSRSAGATLRDAVERLLARLLGP
jgi:hypothetical protein